MSTLPMPERPPVWVNSPEALTALAAELHRYPRIGVDTEANSLHAYREQVCLLQFSTPEADYLVDPLALDDLSPLAPVFASPEVEKIFHAAEYDILGLHRDFGFTFTNLFDTMVSARILGYEKVGLGALLEKSTGPFPGLMAGHLPLAVGRVSNGDRVLAQQPKRRQGGYHAVVYPAQGPPLRPLAPGEKWHSMAGGGGDEDGDGQLDQAIVGIPEEGLADLDGDGVVGLGDLLLLLSFWT